MPVIYRVGWELGKPYEGYDIHLLRGQASQPLKGSVFVEFDPVRVTKKPDTFPQHGRYSHTRPYVRDVLAAADLEVVSISLTDLRLERGERVEGLVVTARRCRAPVAREV